MQAQQEHHVVGPAISDEDHIEHSAKAKGVLSKVKHKARKLKNKMKKVTHSGNSDHGAVDERQREQAVLHSTLAQDRDKDVDDSASDNYDTNDCPQLKYEQLDSINALDRQDNGSDVDGVPTASTDLSGAYWKTVDDNSPVSIYKSPGPPNTLQAMPTEYHHYVATDKDDQAPFGGKNNFDRAQKIKSPGDQQLDMVDLEADRATHDQIHVYSEDLSTDRKLGIGNDDKHRADKREHSMSAADTDNNESPTPSLTQDGANEQMYRPVLEPDNFADALTSESINASLYGDVLAAEDKLNIKDRGAQTGDDYPSDASEEEFSFDKDNLLKMRTQTSESERENVVDGAEQEKSMVDKNDDSQVSKTERLGKWSADKLNNAVDGLALKLGGGGTVEKQTLGKTKSDVDYFDPNNVDDNKFAEQFALSSKNADQDDTLLDSALAGSAAVVEKLHDLKDTIATTLGYGSAPSSDASHGDRDEHIDMGESRSLSGGGRRESIEDKDNELRGIKEMVGLSLGLNSPAQMRQSEQPDAPQLAGTDSNLEGGKSEGMNLSHKWSLDSASDVPQVAFL